MVLTQTQKLMQEKIRNGTFDTYAVVAGIDGKSCTITSENADRDTYFDIASMGKVLVTSTMILKTVGAGKLNLSDTLAKFYPDAPADKREITIEQMLTHTSGMVRGLVSKELGEKGSDAIAAHILSIPLKFAPGSDFVYSCDGPMLMGFILEKIYGKPLDEVYAQLLTEPLGLKRSRFNISLTEENAAVCYRDDHDNRTNRADDEVVYNMKNCTGGAGGSFSSAGDIETVVQAIMQKSLLLYPAYLFDLAEKDYTPNFGEGRGYGYQLGDRRCPEGEMLFSPNTPTFGHIGSTGASFFLNRTKQMYVIILTNARKCSGDSPASGIPYRQYMDAFHALRQEIYQSIYTDYITQHLL